ncbi:MAG: hypothetical protein EA400_11130 [Chromatiaceae bacterium]|nr:MAG: hypothetical protein EA400_11130 [Chromatiaceae bacterium]
MTGSITRLPFAACLLAAAAVAPVMAAGPADAARPCFNVEVQNRPVNQASVQQDCERNYNRTVQAGQQNHAQTIQTGAVNSNKTRQYQYAPWPGRTRPDGAR